MTPSSPGSPPRWLIFPRSLLLKSMSVRPTFLWMAAAHFFPTFGPKSLFFILMLTKLVLCIMAMAKAVPALNPSLFVLRSKWAKQWLSFKLLAKARPALGPSWLSAMFKYVMALFLPMLLAMYLPPSTKISLVARFRVKSVAFLRIIWANASPVPVPNLLPSKFRTVSVLLCLSDIPRSSPLPVTNSSVSRSFQNLLAPMLFQLMSTSLKTWFLLKQCASSLPVPGPNKLLLIFKVCTAWLCLSASIMEMPASSSMEFSDKSKYCRVLFVSSIVAMAIPASCLSLLFRRSNLTTLMG
mmetsp:Transcript_7323/g.13190  ORF Transcript_7323/g.13190 Transcript_7323/m.13190 type:complete len:297 (+) Transcript_7323:1573-2463(+)